MRDPEEFSTCSLCGSSVKLKNMLDHKLRVHRSEMDTGGEKSLREAGVVTDEELRVACDRSADMMSNGEFREAAELYRKVVEADPDNFGAWNDRGLCMKKLNEPGEALDSFEKSIEANPEFAHGWLQKANILFTVRGEVDEARKCYKKAAELDPELIQAWYNLGNVHTKDEEYEEAVRCFDKAIELNDEYYMAWMSKCQALEKIGETEEAEKCFERAYDLNPAYVRRYLNRIESGSGVFSEATGMRAKKDGDKE